MDMALLFWNTFRKWVGPHIPIWMQMVSPVQCKTEFQFSQWQHLVRKGIHPQMIVWKHVVQFQLTMQTKCFQLCQHEDVMQLPSTDFFSNTLPTSISSHSFDVTSCPDSSLWNWALACVVPEFVEIVPLGHNVWPVQEVGSAGVASHKCQWTSACANGVKWLASSSISGTVSSLTCWQTSSDDRTNVELMWDPFLTMNREQMKAADSWQLCHFHRTNSTSNANVRDVSWTSVSLCHCLSCVIIWILIVHCMQAVNKCNCSNTFMHLLRPLSLCQDGKQTKNHEGPVEALQFSISMMMLHCWCRTLHAKTKVNLPCQATGFKMMQTALQTKNADCLWSRDGMRVNTSQWMERSTEQCEHHCMKNWCSGRNLPQCCTLGFSWHDQSGELQCKVQQRKWKHWTRAERWGNAGGGISMVRSHLIVFAFQKRQLSDFGTQVLCCRVKHKVQRMMKQLHHQLHHHADTSHFSRLHGFHGEKSSWLFLHFKNAAVSDLAPKCCAAAKNRGGKKDEAIAPPIASSCWPPAFLAIAQFLDSTKVKPLNDQEVVHVSLAHMMQNNALMHALMSVNASWWTEWSTEWHECQCFEIWQGKLKWQPQQMQQESWNVPDTAWPVGRTAMQSGESGKIDKAAGEGFSEVRSHLVIFAFQKSCSAQFTAQLQQHRKTRDIAGGRKQLSHWLWCHAVNSPALVMAEPLNSRKVKLWDDHEVVHVFLLLTWCKTMMPSQTNAAMTSTEPPDNGWGAMPKPGFSSMHVLHRQIMQCSQTQAEKRGKDLHPNLVDLRSTSEAWICQDQKQEMWHDVITMQTCSMWTNMKPNRSEHTSFPHKSSASEVCSFALCCRQHCKIHVSEKSCSVCLLRMKIERAHSRQKIHNQNDLACILSMHHGFPSSWLIHWFTCEHNQTQF